jgi:hypothetical protein
VRAKEEKARFWFGLLIVSNLTGKTQSTIHCQQHHMPTLSTITFEFMTLMAMPTSLNYVHLRKLNRRGCKRYSDSQLTQWDGSSYVNVEVAMRIYVYAASSCGKCNWVQGGDWTPYWPPATNNPSPQCFKFYSEMAGITSCRISCKTLILARVCGDVPD